MSGGTFDYNQHMIDLIIEEIEKRLKYQGEKPPDEDYEYEVFNNEVKNTIQEGLKFLKIARIYAHRIDWFLAGDDGDYSFLERLK